MTLETPRLLLRPIIREDLGHLVALDNDPEVMRHINGGLPVTREVFEAELLPTFLEIDARSPALGFHAVCDRSSEDFLGWVSLRFTGDDHREAELGYRFRREAWGHGYATEAGRALIDLAFAEPSIHRIIATTYEHNAASRRVMDKLGLTFRRSFRPTLEEIAAVGTSLQGSLEVWAGDDVEYALVRADWQRDRAT